MEKVGSRGELRLCQKEMAEEVEWIAGRLALWVRKRTIVCEKPRDGDRRVWQVGKLIEDRAYNNLKRLHL
jgi:hypothetical protein